MGKYSRNVRLKCGKQGLGARGGSEGWEAVAEREKVCRCNEIKKIINDVDDAEKGK